MNRMKKIVMLLLAFCLLTVGVFAQPVTPPETVPTEPETPVVTEPVPVATEAPVATVAPQPTAVPKPTAAPVAPVIPQVPAAPVATEEPTPTPEPTPFPLDGTKVTVLFTSDIHGNFLQNAETGTLGYSGIAAIKRSLPGSVLVDSGDYLTSTMFITEESINEIVTLMSAAGYDIAGIGEADLENGIDLLKKVQANAYFHMLSTNVTLGTTHQPLLDDYEIIEVNGVKLGFFSILSPDLRLSSSLQNVEGIYLEHAGRTAQKTVDALKKEGVDIVIALTHVGSEGDTNADEIAALTDGIDIILDGHDHQAATGRRGDTVIFNPGANGQQLIQLDITLNNQRKITKYDIVNWTAEALKDLPMDEAIMALEQEIAMKQSEFLSDGVAMTKEAIPYSFALQYQSEPIGNFIADAYRYKTQATIAIVNAGGIESGLPQGEVSKSDIMAALPNQYTVQVKKITPKALKMALEGCFYNIKLLDDGSVDPSSATALFPQISGFTVSVNYQNEPGKRVMEIVLDNGVKLNLNDEYNYLLLASSSGAFNEYDAFKEIPVEEEFGAEGQALLEYLSRTDEQDDYSEVRVKTTNQKENFTGVIVSLLLVLLLVVMVFVFVIKLITRGS